MSGKKLVGEYLRFRSAGYSAAQSLGAAKAQAQFKELESAGLVRLVQAEELENYFAVYGEPEGYTGAHGRRVSAEQEREELVRSIEQNGIWYVGSEWRASAADEWQLADGLGMNMGYRNPLSPVENCYVPDLMRAAVEAVRAQALAPSI